MHDRHLYEYAVIRVVPRIEREEFVNAGVILFSKRSNFIKMLYATDAKKISSFAADIDVEQLELNLLAFQKISEGANDGGPIAKMDVPSRFRWLTAVRSSVIQTSRPHPGLCSDLEATTARLFSELVL